MEEAVEVLTRSWTEEPLVHDGKFFSAATPADLAQRDRGRVPGRVRTSRHSVMMSRVPNARIPEGTTRLGSAGSSARRR
jgi:hypothetical protein